MDSKEFAFAKGKTLAFDYSAVALDLDENGLDDVIASAAYCPKGTQVTGGGGGDFTSTGITFLNTPDEDEGWIYAVAIDEQAQESADDVFLSIVCYSPHGKAFQGSYRPTKPVFSDRVMKVVRRGALARQVR